MTVINVLIFIYKDVSEAVELSANSFIALNHTSQFGYNLIKGKETIRALFDEVLILMDRIN